MQRTVLRIVPLAALLISAAVAILFGALPQSTASERSLQPQKPLRTPLTQTAGLVVVFESPDDAADVLPGERVKFRVSVENPTSRPQTNFLVGMVVSHNLEALEYVDRSTFVSRGDRQSSLPTLDRRGTRIAETFEPHESVTVEWEMVVSECVARDRWVQVVFVARTDEEGEERAFRNLYLHPHTSLPTHHFTASYQVDPRSPHPGEAVRHTVQVVNDGYMALDNVVVRVNSHETIDRNLPTVAANSTYYVVPRRGGEGTSPVAIDSGWSGPETGFNLDYLNPGQTLVLSWVDFVTGDAPVGTVVRPQVDIRPDQADEWKSVARQLTVSPPKSDLAMSIRSIDPEYLAPSYLPGDRVTMRVTVTNHAATARGDLHVDLDLPFALSYLSGSAYLCVGQGNDSDECDAAYAVPAYRNGNARRLPDAWLDTSASLPLLAPGETAAITFRAMVLEDAPPQEDVETHAVLRFAGRDEHRATTHLDIVRPAAIDVEVDGPTTAESGDEVTYKVSITNTGRADLTNVTFGLEETCEVRYIPGTLEADRDYLIDQRREMRDIVYTIGDLAAWRPNGPSNTVDISLKVQIADDVDPGSIDGPRFIIITDRTGAAVAGTTNVSLRGIREETEIEVVEPFVTVEDFETAVRDILDRIEGVAKETKDTAGRTEDLAKDIRETGEKTAGLTNQTRELAGKIKANTTAIEGQAGAILVEVRNANPWGLGWKWVLLWGAFGVLASLVAGFVVWVVVPPPPTLWRVPAWLSERRQRRRNPSLAVPATPPAWRSPGLWWPAAVRASEPLVAALRRVRDWINGRRRR